MAAKKKIAKKKTAKKKTSTSKTMVSMSDFEKQMEEQAVADSARVEGGGAIANSIRIKGGTFTYQDADLGDEMDVVIIDFVNEKAWYDTPYDADNPSSPACYSVSRGNPTDMVPAEDAVKAQCDECDECWANEFGSAETGRGKACNDRRRLAIISVDDLSNPDTDDIEIAMLRTSSTSSNAFDKYVKGIGKVHKRPSYGVITKLSFDDSVEYEKLKFHAEEAISDVAHMQTIMELRERIAEDLEQGYDPDNYSEPKPKKGKKKTSKKKTSKFKR